MAWLAQYSSNQAHVCTAEGSREAYLDIVLREIHLLPGPAPPHLQQLLYHAIHIEISHDLWLCASWALHQGRRCHSQTVTGGGEKGGEGEVRSTHWIPPPFSHPNAGQIQPRAANYFEATRRTRAYVAT